MLRDVEDSFRLNNFQKSVSLLQGPLSGGIKIQDLTSELTKIRMLLESYHLASYSRSLASLASLSIMGFALIKNRKGHREAINTDRPINEEYSC